jgi:hypothetical protein
MRILAIMCLACVGLARGQMLQQIVFDPAQSLGAITNVTVSAVTSTQALLTYTAPSDSACTVQVSHSNTLSPLVHDVDATIFSGANSDGRAGNIAIGTSRQFVIGQRTAQQGSSSYFYSRALQADTTHYYQIACGGATASGTFTTGNIPLGQTFNEDVPANPAATSTPYFVSGGQYAWPDFTSWTDRTETVIDPQTGLLLQRVTMPGDQITLNVPAGDHTFTQIINPSGNWTNPTSVIANDTATASYSGSTSDKLVLTDQNITDANQYPITALTVSLLGWCGGTTGTCATGNNATVDVCLTVNGVTCWPSNSLAQIQAVALGTAALPSSFITGGSMAPILASWTPPGVGPLPLSDILPRSGSVSVNVSGNVTWNGGSYFYPNWVSGSAITLGSSVCTITSSVTSLAFTVTPSNCSPVLTAPLSTSYSANNFGFMVWKQTASLDTIFLQYAKYTVSADTGLGWPASGSPDLCSDTVTQNAVTGDLGFHCVIPSGEGMLYWIDHTTGVANYLGFNPCNTASNTMNGNPDDPTAPETCYNLGTDSAEQVIQSCVITTTNQPRNLSTSCTNIGAASSGTDLLSLIANFTSGQALAFNRTVFPGCGITGLQEERLILGCVESQQDSIGWIVVLDPLAVGTNAGCVGAITPGKPGCVIAAETTYAVAPVRWCGEHTVFDAGQNNYGTVWAAGHFFNSPAEAGAEPHYSSITAGTLTSSPSIAAGSIGCPSGSAGCDIVTVDGEPCNPSPISPDPTGCPKNAAWGYLQPANVGDYFVVGTAANPGSGSELLMLVSKSGNNWLMQRAIPSNAYAAAPQSYSGSLVLDTMCALPKYNSGQWTWNYSADPYGANSSGTTVVPTYSYDHPTPRPAFVVGDDQGGAYSVQPFQTAYAVNNSGILGIPSVFESFSPTFAGVNGITYYAEAAQPHVSAYQDNSPAPWFQDARPMTTASDGPAALVSGQLFAFSSTTSDGDNLYALGGGSWSPPEPGINRKLQATMATCGTQPLTDISSPATGNVISTTSASAYQYCVARSAGECRSGSSQGTVYVNCPNAVTYGGSYTCGYASPGVIDICVLNTGAYLNTVAQVGYQATDQYGLLGRSLTKGLIRQRELDVNENVHGLPDASWMLIESKAIQGNYFGVLAAKLVPYPATDSYSRNTFIPISLSLTAPSGLSITNAIVEFGYAEDGPPSSYFCTTRQDVCTAEASTVGTIPFYFGSETPAGIACAATCTIELPGISQRAIYYNVQYRNAQNAVVFQSGMQVAMVP